MIHSIYKPITRFHNRCFTQVMVCDQLTRCFHLRPCLHISGDNNHTISTIRMHNHNLQICRCENCWGQLTCYFYSTFHLYTLLSYIRVIVPHMGAAWYAVVVDVRATPTYLSTHLSLAKRKA